MLQCASRRPCACRPRPGSSPPRPGRAPRPPVLARVVMCDAGGAATDGDVLVAQRAQQGRNEVFSDLLAWRLLEAVEQGQGTQAHQLAIVPGSPDQRGEILGPDSAEQLLPGRL